MRLLVLTNLYPPQNLGGFGLCLQRLCGGLEGLGYKPLVLTSDAPYLGHAGLDPRCCRSLELLGSYNGGVSRLQDGGEERRRQQHNQKLLERVLRRFQPQVCLVGNLDLLGLELLETVLRWPIPTIQHVGFMGAPMPLGSSPLHHPLYRMAFASGEVLRLLRQQGYPVLNHPVVHPPLASEHAPARSNPAPGPLRLAYSGLLMQSKGVHVLLEAVARLKQMGHSPQVALAGKAFAQGYEQELRTYAKQTGIATQLQWCGFLQGKQLQEFYGQQDVLVFPSLHPESFGMVVAEAMATGVVPISSGVGGAFEVITHGRNGFLVPPGDSEALAKQLAWCCQRREALVPLANRARHDALNLYSPKRSAMGLHQCFQGLVKS